MENEVFIFKPPAQGLLQRGISLLHAGRLRSWSLETGLVSVVCVAPTFPAEGPLLPPGTCSPHQEKAAGPSGLVPLGGELGSHFWGQDGHRVQRKRIRSLWVAFWEGCLGQ